MSASWAQGTLLWACSQPWQGGGKVSKALGSVPQRLARVGAVPAALEEASLEPVSAMFCCLSAPACCQRAGVESQGSWKAAALPDW